MSDAGTAPDHASGASARVVTDAAAYGRLLAAYAPARVPWLLVWARTQAGLTQAQLAAELHVSRSLIARVETGRRRIRSGEAVQWAHATGAPADELLCEAYRDLL